MSRAWIVLGAVAALAALVGAGAWTQAGQVPLIATGAEPGAGATGMRAMPGGLGKPAAAVRLSVLDAALPEEAGEFTVQVAVEVLTPHRELTLEAWGARGVTLEGPVLRELGPGPEGRVAVVSLSGSWTGQGPPRLYLRADVGGDPRPGSRSLAVQVSQAEYRPASEGRLDAERGELVLSVE